LVEEYHTDAATLIGLTYNVVSSAAVALLVALLNRHLQINTEELGAYITPTNELLRFPEYAAFDLDSLESLAAIQSEIAEQALMIGYANLFWLLTWLSLAALPLMLLIPFRRRSLDEA
jgi:DHA2 family multidrug resistance protein